MDTQGNFTEWGEKIAEKLIAIIDRDRKIASSTYLGFSAIKDRLPAICQILARAIALEDVSLVNPHRIEIGEEHGCTRSEQEFNPKEIVREFYLLKQLLLAEFRPQLLQCSSEKILQKLASVDSAIDLLMENSFHSYTENKQHQLEQLREQIFVTNEELTHLIEDRHHELCYLTHEIKNPLTSIVGYSDLFIRQQQLLDAENNSSLSNISHIEQVLHQGRKILRLLNDTLEISSYQQGLKLRIQTVDVCSLIEDIVFGLKSSVNAKHLKLLTECVPDPLKIKTDSLRLQQIITNLLVNAIRYTPSGEIKLTCYEIPQKNILEIKVSDTGVGISEAEQKLIFEPYFRSAKSQKNVPEGVGLGLAIVSQLVMMLKGEISLISEVNVGSTFTVTIPLNPSPKLAAS